ncbi:AAA family ATPase [Cyanobium sp. HWJ4-Hawea]|uniref:AAA family ATPase n=1 Tax=Cyanobium sp. HWJ4-Hawea TaxID=2823713 RepID=UPI0020CE2451|nr:AAA family ATPase [Cyanobium sp. HWJ4-Hawea]MCP9808303.1 AAA family ATPase [Cyanobium sp. HWJ4-Hawea]
MTHQRITDDLDRLLTVLPLAIRRALASAQARDQLIEVVMDLGRVPEARYPDRVRDLGTEAVSRADLALVVDQLGSFGGDNRSGIERTLHRISAIRNRSGTVVGLTCRVGRAVFGTVAMVRDLLDSGQSLLLMGRPGVGKTTALREIARVLADDFGRRVVVIDTSNEIAGDGDIPHPGIGRARRMQVARPELQHQVMIEAVENHMPEVIVIDEIGTELEAQAARTIAERGVMLVATAHGNELANLIKNPTLADLIGGIQTVTLGDEEARRRRSQKTVLERAADPTFPLAVEMHSRQRWLVHQDVAGTVDLLLRGQLARPQVRELGADGQLQVQEPVLPAPLALRPGPNLRPGPTLRPVSPLRLIPPVRPLLRVYGAGISRRELEQVVRGRQMPVEPAGSVELADVVLSVRQQLGRDPHVRRQAQELGIPILVIKSSALPQIQRGLERLLANQAIPASEALADSLGPDFDDDLGGLEECRLAVEGVVLPQGQPVDLLPRSARVRQLQAEFAGHYQLRTAVLGRGQAQRLRVFPA